MVKTGKLLPKPMVPTGIRKQEGQSEGRVGGLRVQVKCHDQIYTKNQGGY